MRVTTARPGARRSHSLQLPSKLDDSTMLLHSALAHADTLYSRRVCPRSATTACIRIHQIRARHTAAAHLS